MYSCIYGNLWYNIDCNINGNIWQYVFINELVQHVIAKESWKYMYIKEWMWIIVKRKIIISVISLFVLSFLIQNISFAKESPVSELTGGIKKPSTQNQSNNKIIKASGIVNIVCFGLDGGTIKSYSRSDTIMVLSVDKKKNKLKVTSLMRDMYVPIPGRGKDKLNAAYSYGGPKLAIQTINTNFGLNIADYVAIDFRGLEKLIDYLGGITICLTSDEAKRLSVSFIDNSKPDDKKLDKFQKGNAKLNGKLAVEYCRIRKIGNGDYERTSRQRKVVELLLQKVKKNGALKLPKTVATILPYIKTSLTSTEIIKLVTSALSLKTTTIEQLRLPVDGTYKTQTLNKMWIISPDLAANKKKLLTFIYGIN